MHLKLLALGLTVLIAAMGCSPDTGNNNSGSYDTENSATAVQPPAHDTSKTTGIPWYGGTVDEAFTLSETSGKPVFLYWGAEWCPPCNQLKATVFKRDAFIAQTRLVIPVYLDGDTPSAQEQGDRFGVYGYPTVILFNPAGEEITRIPGGLELERYLDVVELALNEVRPVKSLVADAVAGKALAEGDWRLLAAYSWGQDNGRVFGEDDDKLSTFRQLAEQCPDQLRVSCSKLQTAAVGEWSRDDERDPALAAEFAQHVETVLNSAELSRTNLGLAIYGGKRVLPTLAEPGSAMAQRIEQSWLQRLRQLRDDQTISAQDRMGTWLGELRLASLHENGVSEELAAAALAAVNAADASIKGEYERVAVINTAWSVLDAAGLPGQADSMLEKEIKTSHSPYYFMLDLAENAKKAGRTEDALNWLERAWRESKGAATRLQWGGNYLLGVLEMSPENLPRVAQVAGSILDEVTSMERAYHGRNARVLKRVFGKLDEWADEEPRVALVSKLRERVDTSCREQNALGCDEAFNAITVAQAG